MFGQLTIIDLHLCNEGVVRDKGMLEVFGKKLSRNIGMRPYLGMSVKRFGKGKLRGLTGVQLIETSSISVHLDESENRAFIDIFSCKSFGSRAAMDFCADYFGAKKGRFREVKRE
jgi:S-adenosylmethionine/arginine decarboxylase-like enzyme